ncbi:hypothetical protein C8J57DRAFT_1721450 [Mycena rebaudengoi]|nr:hypothetical protein C8J57DRAFT_1721450 [Mycena rebaudengoi]
MLHYSFPSAPPAQLLRRAISSSPASVLPSLVLANAPASPAGRTLTPAPYAAKTDVHDVVSEEERQEPDDCVVFVFVPSLALRDTPGAVTLRGCRALRPCIIHTVVWPAAMGIPVLLLMLAMACTMRCWTSSEIIELFHYPKRTGRFIGATYRICDYGSASTKSAILEDLSGRAQSESETLEVHAHIANDLLLLLEVPGTEDLWISRNIWRLLNNLVHRGASTAAACGSLVALLCNNDMPQVVNGALSRVRQINFPLVTTGVSVREKLLDHMADMLDAPSTCKWHYTAIFQILSHLARYESESTAVALVEVNVRDSVEKLLRYRPTDLIDLYQYIFSTLSPEMALVQKLPLDLFVGLWRPSLKNTRVTEQIEELARWWGGSESLVTAKLLDAPREATADSATWASLINFLTVTRGVSVEAKLLAHIVGMLNALRTSKWCYLAIFQILSNLVYHESVAVAVVEANILHSVVKLLRSRLTVVTDLLQPILSMLQSLASHESTAMAVVHMLPLLQLGTLLPYVSTDLHISSEVYSDALTTWWGDLVTTKLLDAPHKAIAEATCSSLVALVCINNIRQAKLLDHIVDMLKALNTAKWRYPMVFQILSHLTLHNESSAVAVVEANTINTVETLLKSHPTDLYEDVFRMLESLVSHESTATAVLDMCLYDLLAWTSIASCLARCRQSSIEPVAN